MITLKKSYKCQETYKNLNNLIKEIIEYETISIHDSLSKDDLVNLLLSNLIKKTNIEKKLNTLKVSIDIFDFNHIFFCLKGKTEDEYTDLLLSELQVALNKRKSKIENEFNFIFPINGILSHTFIEELKEFNKIFNKKISFEEVVNLFGIKLVKKEDYHFYKTEILTAGTFKEDKSHIKELMDSFKTSNFYGLKLEVNINSRNVYFAHKKAIHKIEVFLGFLSFITNYLHRSKSYYSRFEPDRKLQISKLSSDRYFVFKNRSQLIYPYYIKDEKGLIVEDLWQDKKNKIIRELEELELENIKNWDFNILVEFIEIFGDININKSLISTLEDSLRLYYYACKESMLDYSFLKFWMISELIITKTESMTFKTITNRMIQILRSSVKLPSDKFLDEEIGFLFKKRNALVHEGKIDRIQQADRNMAKLIADCVLRTYLEWIPFIKDSDGFNFVLKNIRKSYNNIDQYSTILEELKTPNKFTINLALEILKINEYQIKLSEFKKEFSERTEETNDTVLDNIVKKLIAKGWISQNRDLIKCTSKILLKDNELKFLAFRYNIKLTS